jgi:glucose/arabinose dehydrogenase
MPDVTRRGAIAAIGAALTAGCLGAPDGGRTTTADPERHPYDLAVTHDRTAWDRYDPDWSPPDGPAADTVATETVVENLEIPWDLSFTADGSVFISERTGRILLYDGQDLREVAKPADVIDAGSVPTSREEVVWWVEGGEGGLLGIAAHPGYPEPPVVYAYYTYMAGEDRFNKLVYFDVSTEEPGANATVLIDGIPGAKYHDGSRVTFGPANYLWVTTGDGGNKQMAQDPGRLPGSILRLNSNGTAPADNPGLADPRVYSYGHRNPQGIAWLPDGTTLSNEHGPAGRRDELNRIEPGANYGWPNARTAAEYRGSPYHRPLLSTGDTVWAPSGCCFYTGEGVPSWQNRLLIGALASQEVRVVTIVPPDGTLPEGPEVTHHDGDWLDDAYRVASRPALTDVLGRIRHLEQAPDGSLYAITSNRDGRSGEGFPQSGDDRLVRLTAE